MRLYECFMIKNNVWFKKVKFTIKKKTSSNSVKNEKKILIFKMFMSDTIFWPQIS